MKTSGTWNFKSIAGKIMMGFVLAVMIGNIGVTPAFSKGNDHKRMGRHDNGRYEKRGHAYGHDRRPVYRSYGYRERVYVAPRAVYAPPPPPGIGIFFPPIFIPVR